MSEIHDPFTTTTGSHQLSTAPPLITIILLLVVLLLTPHTTRVLAEDTGDDTTYFRENGGLTSEDVPSDIESKWEKELGRGAIDSSPVVKDGRLVVRTSGIYDWGNGEFEEPPTLYCFELSSGEEHWQVELEKGSGWELSTPLIRDEKVYVGTTAGFVMAYSLATGEELWTAPLQNSSQHLGVTSSPVPLDGSSLPKSIIVADGTGIVYCLDNDDGGIIWQTELDGQIYFTTPVVEKRDLYIGTDTGSFFCLDAKNGNERWNLSLKGTVRTTPFLDGDDIFLATILYEDPFTPSGGYLYKLHDNGDEAQVLWFRTKGPASSSVVCSDDSVFFVSGDFVVAISKDNETLWKYHADGQVQSSLIYSTSSQRLLFTTNSEAGKLYAIDKNGAKVWTKNVKPEAPIFATSLISGDYIVVCSDDGSVHVYTKLELDVNVDFVSLPSVLVGVVGVAVLVKGKEIKKIDSVA